MLKASHRAAHCVWLMIASLVVMSAVLTPPARTQVLLAQASGGCDAGHRFENRADGTVVDCSTRLLWLKDASCFGLMNWPAAVAVVSALAHGECGLTDGSTAGDWRLPEISEFCSTPPSGHNVAICPPSAAANSLINMHFIYPALSDSAGVGHWRDGDPFLGPVAIPYWSASPDSGSEASAWAAHVGTGLMGSTAKSFSQYVWPVRELPVDL